MTDIDRLVVVLCIAVELRELKDEEHRVLRQFEAMHFSPEWNGSEWKDQFTAIQRRRQELYEDLKGLREGLKPVNWRCSEE